MLPNYDKCSHGISFKKPCQLCEIISLTETIKSFEPLVKKAKRKLKRLRSGKHGSGLS